MLLQKKLSYVTNGAMLLWIVVLLARISFGNQLWQDIFQILIGVVFSLYGVALISNWRGVGEYLIRGAEVIDPRRYKLGGYLWLIGGVGIAIGAIILIVISQ